MTAAMSAHHAADQKTLVTQAEMSCAAKVLAGRHALLYIAGRSCFVVRLFMVTSDDFECFDFPLLHYLISRRGSAAQLGWGADEAQGRLIWACDRPGVPLPGPG